MDRYHDSGKELVTAFFLSTFFFQKIKKQRQGSLGEDGDGLVL